MDMIIGWKEKRLLRVNLLSFDGLKISCEKLNSISNKIQLKLFQVIFYVLHAFTLWPSYKFGGIWKRVSRKHFHLNDSSKKFISFSIEGTGMMFNLTNIYLDSRTTLKLILLCASPFPSEFVWRIHSCLVLDSEEGEKKVIHSREKRTLCLTCCCKKRKSA